jgi:hypothetical protein
VTIDEEEFKKLSYREQLRVLLNEAFDAEDYVTLKKIRLKILEYDREHPLLQKSSFSLAEYLHQK